MTRTTIRIALVLGIAAVGAAIPVACSDDSASTAATGTNTGTLGAGAGMGQAGAAGSSAGGGATGPAECQGHIYQCGDMIDNDTDGKVDAEDADCLGACDDTEDSYYGGIPGQAGPPCVVDCYFDQDSGPGNDDCYWNHQCDPNEVAPNYYPESCNGAMCAYNPAASTPGTGQSCDELQAAQSQECLDYCGPLTPNGCDCFGCCELPAGSDQWVWLGSDDDCIQGSGTCDIASVEDPASCQPCQPVQACINECDLCEICIGKPTLPPECFDPDGGGAGGGGTVPGQCPEGVQQCGLPGQDPCPAGYYCITGCCQALPE